MAAIFRPVSISYCRNSMPGYCAVRPANTPRATGPIRFGYIGTVINDAAPQPSPDISPRDSRREGRGRLKILLGAAPGVGKTFKMLRDGADLLRTGRDVVVGIVETHGSAETEALAAPFETIAPRTIASGVDTVAELDLDALLARNPQVALIDDLAHNNVAGGRHPKRWQDIDEIRGAGIDVVTTVNIQHVESLGDIVAGFLRIRILETVPDSVFDDAEIEVVDLPPDELIARLQAGKVYLSDDATRANPHFYSKSNLSALRELALRRAAQTVDRQMLDHLRSTGEGGSFSAGVRLIVAIGDQPGSDNLIRAAKRLADALGAQWTAVSVETPRTASLSPAARATLAASLKLATTLGAAIVTVPAPTVMAGLRAMIIESQATAVVIGKSRRSWWFELRHGSVVDALVRDLDGVAVHVVPATMTARHDDTPVKRPWATRGIAFAAATVTLTTVLAWIVAPFTGPNSIDLLYLLPVIATATLFGLRPSLFASLAAALAYNFFFLLPLYTFTIEDPQNMVTLVVLVIVATVASQLTGRLQREATVGVRMANENAALAAFGQRLAAVSDEAGTARIVCDEVGRLLHVSTILLARKDGKLTIAGANPADVVLDPIDHAAADWAFDRGEPAGRDTTTITASDWQFHPLATSMGVLGVIGVGADHGEPVPSDRRLLFTTLIGQAALAHERLRAEADLRELVALKQRDELRATLLSSIGHDLKTPLTAVVAAAEAMATTQRSPEAALLKSEARRLRRVFDNLVEMTRLETGAAGAGMEATDLVDAIGGAVHDLRADLGGHKLVLDVPASLPLVEADPRMLNHILVNLVGNAAKFSAAGTPITIQGRRTASGVTLAVIDAGPGLPPGGADILFERFTRVTGTDMTGGTGLGLAIVKGFATAMGLGVRAGNRTDGDGAMFALDWPETLLRHGPAADTVGAG
jgi:two-component system, OmpR family, sensor histidine kinase KdpD